MNTERSQATTTYMLWPERRRVSHDVIVVWAQDAIDNGACQMNPLPTLAQLQCDPKLARDVVEKAGYATFRACLRSAS